jgi:hypothetical protein
VDSVGPSGGSLALAELIDKHGTALVADFLSEYGVRLVDVLFEWPPREVLALVEGLPDTSVYAAYVAGGSKWQEFRGWGKTRHMLADQWDLTLAHAMAGTKKKPTQYPRPTVRQAQQGVSLMQMIRSLRGPEGE